MSPIDGSIFFSPMSETAVAKWNPSTNHQRFVFASLYSKWKTNSKISYRVLAYDADQFQFVADMRIQARDPNSLYVLSSKFHRFFLKNLEPTEVNTRILRIEGIHPSKVPTLNTNHYSVYNPKPSKLTESYLQNAYFDGIRQPYQYEAVGVINKAIKNPFSSLNTGERPEPVSYYREKVPKYGLLGNENYYNTVSQGDFNGLRITKSVAYNTSTLHHSK